MASAAAQTASHAPRRNRTPMARGLPDNGRQLTAEMARYFGAISILVVGGIHAQQYYDAYFRVVPTITTVFLGLFLLVVGSDLVHARTAEPSEP